MRPVLLADLAAPATERAALRLAGEGVRMIAISSCATVAGEIAYVLGRRGARIDWRAVDFREPRALERTVAWGCERAGPGLVVLLGGTANRAAEFALASAVIDRIEGLTPAYDACVYRAAADEPRPILGGSGAVGWLGLLARLKARQQACPLGLHGGYSCR